MAEEILCNARFQNIFKPVGPHGIVRIDLRKLGAAEPVWPAATLEARKEFEAMVAALFARYWPASEGLAVLPRESPGCFMSRPDARAC